MVKLTQADIDALSKKKGASKYRYLTSDELRKHRQELRDWSKEIGAQILAAATNGQSYPNQLHDLHSSWFQINGQISRCTTILRDRWEEP